MKYYILSLYKKESKLIMKKTIILLATIMLVPIFSSCGNKDYYTVQLYSGIESGIFNNSIKLNTKDASTSEIINDSTETTFMLGKQTITADLVSKIVDNNSLKSIYKNYESKDKNITYSKSTNNDSFFIRAKNEKFLSSPDYKESTEENFLKFIRTYISSFIDVKLLDDYVYSCTTTMVVSIPDATWKESKNEFYIAQDDSETVTSYKVEYQKYCNNMPTADKIVVVCDKDWSITDFYYYQYNIDWNTVKFDNDMVYESVKKFLESNLNTDNTLVDFNIQSQFLTLNNGEIELSVTAEVILKCDGEEFVVLCSMYLSQHTQY